MKLKNIFKIILFLLLATHAYAQVTDIEGDSKPYLNQQLRRTKSRLNSIENYTINSWSGTLTLDKGGTEVSLSDPGGDRILFWDDSESEISWLTANTNMSITHTSVMSSDHVNPKVTFGTWASPTNGSSQLAATDGILTWYSAGNSNCRIKTDSANPPTVIRQTYTTVNNNVTSLTCPVKEGDYYLIEDSVTAPCAGTGFWLPLN